MCIRASFPCFSTQLLRVGNRRSEVVFHLFVLMLGVCRFPTPHISSHISYYNDFRDRKLTRPSRLFYLVEEYHLTSPFAALTTNANRTERTRTT